MADTQVLFHLYISDPRKGKKWEHSKSPWAQKADGTPPASAVKAASDFRKKYGNLGYKIELVEEVI